MCTTTHHRVKICSVDLKSLYEFHARAGALGHLGRRPAFICFQRRNQRVQACCRMGGAAGSHCTPISFGSTVANDLSYFTARGGEIVSCGNVSGATRGVSHRLYPCRVSPFGLRHPSGLLSARYGPSITVEIKGSRLLSSFRLI